MQGLEVAQHLLVRDLDGDDLHVPLLLWWAVEQHAADNLEDTLARFTSPAAWRSGMTRSAILVRLVRRLAALKNAAGDAACARLIASSPSREARRPLLLALDEAMSERRASDTVAGLARSAGRAGGSKPHGPHTGPPGRATGSHAAVERARVIAADIHAGPADRLAMLELLGEPGTVRPWRCYSIWQCMKIDFRWWSGRVPLPRWASLMIHRSPRRCSPFTLRVTVPGEPWCGSCS